MSFTHLGGRLSSNYVSLSLVRFGALKAYEERGWEALPLAPEILNKLVPELWATQKAAERWLGNSPLNPSISIIRF
jgi:hypothetical protein